MPLTADSIVKNCFACAFVSLAASVEYPYCWRYSAARLVALWRLPSNLQAIQVFCKVNLPLPLPFSLFQTQQDQHFWRYLRRQPGGLQLFHNFVSRSTPQVGPVSASLAFCSSNCCFLFTVARRDIFTQLDGGYQMPHHHSVIAQYGLSTPVAESMKWISAGFVMA